MDLKTYGQAPSGGTFASRPARGEWIEKTREPVGVVVVTRLAPQGASGLKNIQAAQLGRNASLAPQGASGLKSLECQGLQFLSPVSPRKGRVD